jgi:hypothetical protein
MDNLTNEPLYAKTLAPFLGLSKPWYVKYSKLETNPLAGGREYHIHLDVLDSAMFTCPHCQRPTRRSEFENIPRK